MAHAIFSFMIKLSKSPYFLPHESAGGARWTTLSDTDSEVEIASIATRAWHPPTIIVIIFEHLSQLKCQMIRAAARHHGREEPRKTANKVTTAVTCNFQAGKFSPSSAAVEDGTAPWHAYVFVFVFCLRLLQRISEPIGLNTILTCTVQLPMHDHGMASATIIVIVIIVYIRDHCLAVRRVKSFSVRRSWLASVDGRLLGQRCGVLSGRRLGFPAAPEYGLSKTRNQNNKKHHRTSFPLLFFSQDACEGT